GLVDDEVDARQVLERTDVPALPADDAPLHVVGRKLDHRHRRLRGMARGHALQRIGHEVPRPPLRLGACLVLEHADATREVVPCELFAALEQVRLRVLQRHAGDPLELLLLRRLRLLELVLELAEMRLPVGEPLILALEVDELSLDLLLLREHPLFDLHDGAAPVGELAVDLGPQLDGLLARLDLCLTPERLRLALRVPEHLPPDAAAP